MTAKRWKQVDDYITAKLVGGVDPKHVLAANAKGGLPTIDVSAPAGKFLHLLARMSGARRILEIGTLGGYSTIWLARGLKRGGKVVTLEADPHHAEVARRNIAKAGLSARVDIRVGLALDILPTLKKPFDLVFIDADKSNNARYVDWAIKLGRPGTVIVVDNVIRKGAVVDAASRDESVLGTRRLFDSLAKDKRIGATALQTVGSKGWDGMAIMVVN